MDFKKISLPITAAILFVAFAIACAMVWLYRGKSRTWLNRKMKFGAAIIAITTVSTGCPLMLTCYDMPATDQFNINGLEWDTLGYFILNLPADSTLEGTVYSPQFQNYEARFMKSDTLEVFSTKVIPTDGQFNSDNEAFQIKLKYPIEQGNYTIQFWAVHADTLQYEVSQIPLKIKQE